MTKGRFIAKYLTGGYIAGLANTAISFMSKDPNMRTTHKNETVRRYDNTSWSYTTGILTKGAQAGAVYNLINPAVAGGATASSESGNPVNPFVANSKLYFMAGAKTASSVAYTVRKG